MYFCLPLPFAFVFCSILLALFFLSLCPIAWPANKAVRNCAPLTLKRPRIKRTLRFILLHLLHSSELSKSGLHSCMVWILKRKPPLGWALPCIACFVWTAIGRLYGRNVQYYVARYSLSTHYIPVKLLKECLQFYMKSFAWYMMNLRSPLSKRQV